MAERYLTVAQVAGLLTVHVQTVRSWIRAGKLRGIALSDKSGYRVAEADLAAFIAERTGRTMAETEAAPVAA